MNTSRLYSFINNKHGFTVNFLEGHALIDELQKIHNIGPNAAEFYRKIVLSAKQMITFLKPGENLGLYIDSEDPFFRFKIEMSQNGAYRTLLLPEEFESFPENFTGKIRVNKVYSNKAPYTSIIEVEKHSLDQIINEIMAKSYQTNSQIYVTEKPMSLMINKLPPTNINKKIEDFSDISLEKYRENIEPLFKKISKLNDSTVEDVVDLFEQFDLKYIGSKEVKFNCPCSRERMENHLHSLSQIDKEDLFKEIDTVDTRCDYCNTVYSFTKLEVIPSIQ